MAARAGRTLAQIGEVLGHSSQYMTEVYTHLDVDDARETVESVAGVLGVRHG
jgi:site-specific recombinase XerC